MGFKIDKLNHRYAKKFSVEEAKELAFLCIKTQTEMKSYLGNRLTEIYKDVFSGDGFLYARGEIPVCLIAHMDVTDTVKTREKDRVNILERWGCKRKKIEYIYEKKDKGKHFYESPQGIGGDDRCGIYTILKILQNGYKPYILFTEDEEQGCVGARKFATSTFIKELANMKFLVQIDRKGNNDAVFYDDINQDFHDWVEQTTDFVEAVGSYTDICELSDVCRVSSVNLSSGYYNEHTEYETVCIEELLRTIAAVEKLLIASNEVDQFKFKEKFSYGNYGSIFDFNELMYEFTYMNKNGEEEIGYGEGATEMECIADFLMANSCVRWNDVVSYCECKDFFNYDTFYDKLIV